MTEPTQMSSRESRGNFSQPDKYASFSRRVELIIIGGGYRRPRYRARMRCRFSAPRGISKLAAATRHTFNITSRSCCASRWRITEFDCDRSTFRCCLRARCMGGWR